MLLNGLKLLGDSIDMKKFKENMKVILETRRGGNTTIRIIDEILKNPLNKNQLAKKLQLDYRTIIYHTNITTEYDLIDEKIYGKTSLYYPSEKLLMNMGLYKLIKENVKKKQMRK